METGAYVATGSQLGRSAARGAITRPSLMNELVARGVRIAGSGACWSESSGMLHAISKRPNYWNSRRSTTRKSTVRLSTERLLW